MKSPSWTRAQIEPMQGRHNLHLHNYIEEQGIDALPLPPDPLTIDGELFDPREHFRAWRQADTAAMVGFKARATAGLQYALLEIPEGPRRYKRIADMMNGRGIKTFRGGA